MEIELYPPLCIHEIGQRKNNEDSIYPAVGEPIGAVTNNVFIVCDGVGGHERGEVASRMACEVIANYGVDGKLNEESIDEAVSLVETEMDNYIRSHVEARGMATTLTLLSIGTQGITIAHIGDSRIYQLRGNEIIDKTTDHSFVNELVSQNIISEEEAIVHPKRNVITKAIVGDNNHQTPETKLITNIEQNDYFFLCTDGIIESVSDMELTQIISTPEMSNEEKLSWIKIKCMANSKDNFSAYLLQVRNVSL